MMNLVRRELKVRYKDSALGFLWSMLNPLLYLVVFYFVFVVFLPSGIPYFPVYLLSGLIPWNLFAASMLGSTGSVVANGALLKKVYFPREVLPFSAIGASLVHFFLQSLVLVAALLIFRYPFFSENLVLIPIALITQVLLLAWLSLLLSSITVYLRDTQHFLELALLAWFWMTPIVYPIASVYEKLGPKGLFGVYMLNPMAPIVLAFQRAYYNRTAIGSGDARVQILMELPMTWYLKHLGAVAAVSLVMIFVAEHVFSRFEGKFAEEL